MLLRGGRDVVVVCITRLRRSRWLHVCLGSQYLVFKSRYVPLSSNSDRIRWPALVKLGPVSLVAALGRTAIVRSQPRSESTLFAALIEAPIRTVSSVNLLM